MPGEHGTAAVGLYVPPGTTADTIPKPIPNSPQMPLQTTFPTPVAPGVLPGLAATAGSGSDGSSGILSSLFSEDSAKVGTLSEADSQDVGNLLTWPTGDKPRQGARKETSTVNGIPSITVARFSILTFWFSIESPE